MKKQHLLFGLFICFIMSLTPSVKAQTNAQLQANITKLRKQGVTGKRLQDMVLQRAAGLMTQNRPYVMNGTVDCWGYVRQTWNAILVDCNIHTEEFNSKTSHRWVANPAGGLLVGDGGSNDWQPINGDWSKLAPGVPLASKQGHYWGGAWHGVIYVKQGQQYESTPATSPSGAALRTRDAGMKYYYKPLNDLLLESSGSTFVVSPESEKHYIVEAGVKHWLMDGNEVAKRGGIGKIQTISKAEMDKIPTGIAYGTVIPTGNFRRVVFKASNDPNNTTYVVLGGQKKHLCRLPITYNGIEYTGADVEIVSAQAANAVPTGTPICPAVPTPTNKVYTERLSAGQQLNPGDILKSANGAHQLVYQTDGNLVIYRNGAAVWHSHTNGQAAGFCAMQGDGNLVIYKPGGVAIWSTGTHTCQANFLAMQDDGNLVLYTATGTAVWNTVTQSNLTNMNSTTGKKLCN